MKNMAYCLLVIQMFFFIFSDGGSACTTFILRSNEGQVFGRNFDWSFDDALLVVNKRGCRKKSTTRSEEKGQKAIWTAKYGSLTFNQYGRELPQGGMNEVGLVVEGMSLKETQYPIPDSRPYVGSSLQWRQYILDTCATVAEVIATDKKIRITNTSRGPGVHFLVLDKDGDCALIEFLDGHMKIYRGSNLPVAVSTNSPYEASLEYLQINKPPIIDKWNSIQRFITASHRLKGYDKDSEKNNLVDYAFNTLSEVSFDSTQWRIVYDNINMHAYFKTKTNNKIRYIHFSKLDFSPQSQVKILDANAKLTGDVTNDFSVYSYDANRRLIGVSYKQVRFLSRIPNERLDAIARFPESFECKK